MAFSAERQWCCCGSKSATMIAGTIVMVISCFQLMLHILIYAYSGIEIVVENLITGLYLGLGIMDVIIIIISIIMLVQNDKENSAGGLMAWLILMGVYVVYEAGINTFNLVVLGAAQVTVDGYPPLIPPIALTLPVDPTSNPLEYIRNATIAYWGIKIIVYIALMVAVAGRYRDMRNMMTDYRDTSREAAPQQKASPQMRAPQQDYGYRQQPPPQNMAYQQNTNYGYRY